MRISDWSSDVCSSDLRRNRHPDLDVLGVFPLRRLRPLRIKSFTLRPSGSWFVCGSSHRNRPLATTTRSESPYALPAMQQIGRASCRERVCQYVLISVVAVTLKKKTQYT